MNLKHLSGFLACYPEEKIFANFIADELGVPKPFIIDTLREYEKEWQEAKCLEQYDAVIEKYMQILTYDGPVENVWVETRVDGSEDRLHWTYNGKEYKSQGYFFIDDDDILHHKFIAPNGKEINVTTHYQW